MTHVEIQQDLLPLIGRVENVLDGITGFVEHYDFSRANSSYEARVQTITKVASICYANPKSLGSISLFDRLQAESGGLPSSSYEFIPVLVSMTSDDHPNSIQAIFNIACGEHIHDYEDLSVIKYGDKVENGDYLLTNLRALIADVGPEASLNYLNTSEEEIQVIRDNFKVFLFNVDLSTRAQMVRHRVSWQELSRRYVSGTKSPFEFYKSAKLNKVTSNYSFDEFQREDELDTDDIVGICLNHYFKALDSGVKPEEARRILPQAMMTQIWGAFQPKQLDGFFNLRLDKHAQLEIRCVAEAMKGLING